jgi:hypothetical protein
MPGGIVRASIGILLLTGSVAAVRPCPAQGIPFSQRGATSQTVAFTEIAILYSRPVARGRVLFGDSAVVRWDRIWHPGADSATRISFSRDVLLEEHHVPAGTYSLWLLPRERAPWTLILSRAAYVYHAPYPGEEHEVLRIDITPERGAHMETLAIYFPLVLRDEATLRVHWGDMLLPVRIKAPYRPPLPANDG